MVLIRIANGLQGIILCALIFLFCCDNVRGKPKPSKIKHDRLRIGYLSSWQRRCGIAQYTKNIYAALTKAGFATFVFDYKLPYYALLNSLQNAKVDILNIQYEPALIMFDLVHFIGDMQRRGIKVFLTIHGETEEVRHLVGLVDGVIYHKVPQYVTLEGNRYLLPMGVPVFSPQLSREELRAKYGFKSNHKILTTAGFLAVWKENSDILERLVPWLKSSLNHRIQLLTPINDFAPEVCMQEKAKIQTVIAKHRIKRQVVHITRFLSQRELNERLWISDLGYLWGGRDTGSSSAASKEFVSSRLPLIVTNSSHYHDIKLGAIKTPIDKSMFIQSIIDTINSHKLIRLRKQLKMQYNKLNYDSLIKDHITLFEHVFAA